MPVKKTQIKAEEYTPEPKKQEIDIAKLEVKKAPSRLIYKEAEETNILLQGKMKINDKIVEAGSVFRFPKKQIACPIFLEDCHIVCIKEPCVIGDKYCI